MPTKCCKKNKERLQVEARERYENLSEEEKKKKQKKSHEKYRNISEEKKKELVIIIGTQ